MSENQYETYLRSVQSTIEADIVSALLESEGIPVHKKHNLTGDYLEVFANATIFGIDLYVPPQELEKAKEILSAAYEITDEDIYEDQNNEFLQSHVENQITSKEPGLLKRRLIKIYILLAIGGTIGIAVWAIIKSYLL